MTNKKKPGFNGQFVEGIHIGTHVDSDGDPIKVSASFLEKVVKNYDPKLHEAPAVIGHPESNKPAYGWVSSLRVRDGKLETQFGEVDPNFEEIVRNGYFKKRSMAFYLDPATAPGGRVPYLQHVGFLGAKPPAVKGLKDIQFNEADEVTVIDFDSSTTEFSEGDVMTDAEKKAAEEQTKKTVRESVSEFLKEMFGGKDKDTTASFSEADAQRLIEGAVTKVQTSFEEKITKLEDENKRLRETVDTQVGSSTRREIVAFCDDLQAKGVLPPAFKARVVAFAEALAGVPDKKVTVITFEEKDGKEVEQKREHSLLQELKNLLNALPPYIQFGESFGSLRTTGDGSEIIDPKQRDVLRESMGLSKEGAAAAK